MSYAEKTTVSPEKSKAEIEAMLVRYGADQFVSGWANNQARIQFRANNRYVRFVLTMPDRKDERFTLRPNSTWKKRSEAQAKEAWDQEVRRLWRALALVVKAKLEAVESKIVSFEDEFMAHIILPDGKTVSEHASPMIAEAYKSGRAVALLPGW